MWYVWDEKHIVVSIIEPQEETALAYEEKQPLHVKRTDLIAAVQKRFDEEKQKRADAEKARSEARQAAVAAVQEFSGDQLTNIVAEYLKYIGSMADNDYIVKWAKDKQEAGAFVTKELQVTLVETSLEKWVRVLELATDEEIEVTPTDEVYSLL